MSDLRSGEDTVTIFRPFVDVEVGDDSPTETRRHWKDVIIWSLLVILTPFLSPLYFLGILFYQFCLYGRKKLTGKDMVLTGVCSAFTLVAWIPYVNMYLYFRSRDKFPHGMDTTEQKIDGLAPFVAFYFFTVWGSIIAWRIFSLRDSYEQLEDRANMKKLKDIGVNPEIQIKRGKKELGVKNAFELYEAMKRPFSNGSYYLAGAVVVILSVGFAVAVRTVYNGNNMDAASARDMYIFSTIFFCGIFIVFYSVQAIVVMQFYEQCRMVESLAACVESGIRRRLSTGIDHEEVSVKLSFRNISHISAWDEVRRAVADELIDKKSLLNTFFYPSCFIMAVGTVVCYAYLVISLLFVRKKPETFAFSMMILLAECIAFLSVILFIASRTQGRFKQHEKMVGKALWECAQELDKQTCDENRGTTLMACQSPQFSFHDNAAILDDDNCPMEVPELQDLYSTLNSLMQYMNASPAEVSLLGMDLRRLSFAGTYFLLLNANVLFFSLTVAFSEGRCHPGDANYNKI